MKPFLLLQKYASYNYPYRWIYATSGLIIILILGYIANKFGTTDRETLENAIYLTFAFIASSSIATAVLSFQIDPIHGELRDEKDDSLFVKVYNICMRTILALLMLALIALTAGMAVNAWIAIIG